MGDAAAILSSPRLATTLEALARAYDHVVIDAGAMSEMPVASCARIAPRAILVAVDAADAAAKLAREQLLAAGFSDVTMLPGNPGEAAPPQPVAA